MCEAFHINSAKDNSVRGVEVWQYSNSNKKLNEFSKGMCEDISGVFNVRNRGVKLSQSLSVLKNTKMPACLVEVDFISNVAAEIDLNNNENIKRVARGIRDNIVVLFELKKANEGYLYKVCIGAFEERSNAINLVEISKNKGFSDTYII